MMAKFALRDSGLLAVTAFFWWLAAGLSGGQGPVADLAGLLAGLLVGASAYVLHEWGHLLAGLGAGSVLQLNGRLRAPYTFRFDPEKNSLSQFVVMSLGGFAVTAAVVTAAYVALPDGLLATRVARGAVLFLALLGVVLELPLLLVGIVRGTVPVEAAVKLERPSSEAAAAR